ncbi:GLPGLI family protein [Chryseobacterium sp. SNU WT5]|uniref:GLPGLI family protein n=1 Tax=Chryseobacterium sp. SNU WT5 TaxID=2594269 RepID=UPI00117DF21F|nr:GLPGLI family protein [Chryseobacterium sp. SNU WT5]QDP86559.1 GLPGLI family protein [Chryseobacterium sp. SNU WT5]
MKKLIVLSLLTTIFLSAQNKRFTYEYSYIMYSTNMTGAQKELVVLDVSPNGSIFYSLNKFKSDSLQHAELQKMANSSSDIINVKETYKGKILYTISKSYPKFETFLHTKVGTDPYKVLDNRKPDWTISSEKQNIENFEVQKAVTNLFGRKWTAWFATDLPIPDGPYKFQGLPGLIVKIEDEKQTHSFILKGIGAYVDIHKLELEEKNNYFKEVTIDYPKYKKLYLEQLSDPTKSLRQLVSRSNVNVKIMGADGNEIKLSEVLRQRQLKSVEDRKKNNNPLELDLLK